MAADKPRQFCAFGPLRALLFGLVLLAMSTGGIIEAPSYAVDYTTPSLTAWQRSHEGRLTIEWAETARVQQKRSGDKLILRFAKPLATNITPALRNISNFVDPDRATVEGTDLSLALKPGVSAKVSVREKRIVSVTFSHAPIDRSSFAIEAKTTDDGIQLILDWPGPTRTDLDRVSDELTLEAYPAWDIDPAELTTLQRTLRPWFTELRSAKGQDRTSLHLTLAPEIVATARAEGAKRTIVELTRDASKLPSTTTRPASHAFIPKKRPPILASAEVGVLTDGPPIPKQRPTFILELAETDATQDQETSISAKRKDPPKTLTIEWKKPVAAAIFVRAGHLWTVFDEPDENLLSASPTPPSMFGHGEIVPSEGGTALRFQILEPVDIDVGKTAGGHWQITPVSLPSPPRSLDIQRVATSPTLQVKPVSGEHIVRLVDPLVGDQIDVMPTNDPGLGLPVRRRFVDVELLPTTQGLAWRRLNDQLITTTVGDSLEFSSPNGLSLSSLTADNREPSTPSVIDATATDLPSDDVAAEEPAVQPAIMPADPTPAQEPDAVVPASYFNLAGSGVERPLVGEFRRIRRQAISKATPEERDRARLDLARLLVSERLAIEARTVLNAISDQAESDVILQKQALNGVAAFLIGRLTEASALLLDADLSDDQEIDVWRAALNSFESEWQEAAERWRSSSTTLDLYPPRLKLDLGLMAVEAAIETEDDEMVSRGIRRLSTLPLSAYDKARVEAMKALQAKRSGNIEKARRLLTDLTESPNPKVRTLAGFQLASLDLDSDADRTDSLNALHRSLPLWRGHPEEKAMLDKLAHRFKDANALRMALTTWRRLIQLFPEAENDGALRTKRQNTFVEALNNAAEPAIDPLDVYAIYLDFIDLLPSGPQARNVHRQLARHLSDLDLLDQAIDVLQPLMASTEDDLERNELAADIALLMLSQDRAGPALSILGEKERASASLPTELVEKRRLARARALAELNRTDEAVREIQDLQSRSARYLRARILWNDRRWPRLAAVAEAYFSDDAPISSLSENDQELVLWLALARQRTGASDQLGPLRERFGVAMRAGPYAEAFDVATQSLEKIDEVDTLLAATESQLAELKKFRGASPSNP